MLILLIQPQRQVANIISNVESCNPSHHCQQKKEEPWEAAHYYTVIYFTKMGALPSLPAALPSNVNRSPVAGTAFMSQSAQGGYLFFNFVSSIVITFINDAVFSKAEFGYPAYLCLYGFVATFIGAEIMRWFSLVEPIKQQIPTLKDPNFLLLVIVVGLSKTLNNASLKHNSMGFYQIFKLLVTPLVVILEFGLDARVISFQRIVWLSWVCLFVLMSVHGDMQFSMVGAVWASIWVPFAAIYKVQWSRVRKTYGCSTVSLMHAVMPYAIVLQLFLAPIVDPPGIRDYQWTIEAIILMAMSGFAAFFVTLSGFLVIGNVSPLAHTLLGPVKTAVAMIAARILYEMEYSTMQLLGAAGALISLAFYTHVTIADREQSLLSGQAPFQLVTLSPNNQHHYHYTETVDMEIEYEPKCQQISEEEVELVHNHIS